MARTRTGDKLGDIRRATIAEVVEVGSSAASIKAIAKRANLAVGTIYRYHDNKDHLLRAVYLAVKTEIHHSMMASVAATEGSKAKIRSMWFNLLEYACKEPDAFLFAEVVMNASHLSPAERSMAESLSEEPKSVIRAAIADGTLSETDMQAINILLIAPALHLARRAALSGSTPDRERSEKIFSLCWRAIAD